MALSILQFCIGLLAVGSILMSAIRTVVLPHAGSVRLTKAVFVFFRRAGNSYGRIDGSPHRRHAAMQFSVAVAVAVTVALLSLPVMWLTVALGGYTLMFQSLGTDSWRDSYDLAGSASRNPTTSCG